MEILGMVVIGAITLGMALILSLVVWLEVRFVPLVIERTQFAASPALDGRIRQLNRDPNFK
jgi:hypothetical protein